MSLVIDWSELPTALQEHNDVTIRGGSHHALASTTIAGKAFTLRFAEGAQVIAND